MVRRRAKRWEAGVATAAVLAVAAVVQGCSGRVDDGRNRPGPDRQRRNLDSVDRSGVDRDGVDRDRADGLGPDPHGDAPDDRRDPHTDDPDDRGGPDPAGGRAPQALATPRPEDAAPPQDAWPAVTGVRVTVHIGAPPATGARVALPTHGDHAYAVWSADGRQLWVVTGPEHREGRHIDHVRVAALPPGARLMPVTEYPAAWTPFVVVSGDGRHAWPLPPAEPLETVEPDDEGVTVSLRPEEVGRLPVEPAPGAPRDPSRALAVTVALRYMQSCPASRETCLLSGPPARVRAARDPLVPEGGWLLHDVDALNTPRALSMPKNAFAVGPLRVAVLGRWTAVPGATSSHRDVRDNRNHCAAWLATDPTTPVFEWACWRNVVRPGPSDFEADVLAGADALRGGVTRADGYEVAWLWVTLSAEVHAAVLDPRRAPGAAATLTRRSVVSVSYYDLIRDDELHGYRPLPLVRGPPGRPELWFAVTLVGAPDGILYAPGQPRGRRVPARVPIDLSASERHASLSDVALLPPALSLDATGTLTPARP